MKNAAYVLTITTHALQNCGNTSGAPEALLQNCGKVSGAPDVLSQNCGNLSGTPEAPFQNCGRVSGAPDVVLQNFCKVSGAPEVFPQFCSTTKGNVYLPNCLLEMLETLIKPVKTALARAM